MGQFGIWQIVIIIILAVLLFGRGKISQLIGDVAKGINAFKKGMKEGGEDEKPRDAIDDRGATIDPPRSAEHTTDRRA